MNAYDFDNTIYSGESIFDFFKFCLTKDVQLYIFFPEMLIRLIQYKLNLLTDRKIYKTAEKIINSFMKRNNHKIDELVEEFWDKNRKKLKIVSSPFLRGFFVGQKYICICFFFLMYNISRHILPRRN